MIHELNIMTNDGWVITLVGNKDIDPSALGLLFSIIVQPKANHDARVLAFPEYHDLARREYRLTNEYSLPAKE